MNYWFTADHHFGHSNIIKFCNRPFDSTNEMNEAFIQTWNKWVNPNDHVFHLGDFSFSGNINEKILPRLNGKKNLIVGNHDPIKKFNDFQKSLWNSIQENLIFNINENKIFLAHRPHRAWDGSYHGSFHLFGHVHGRFENIPYGRSMDVGVDPTAWRTGEYRPVNLDEILEILKNRPPINC